MTSTYVLIDDLAAMRFKFNSIVKSPKPPFLSNRNAWSEDQNGMVLVLVLSFLAIISLLGATAILVTTIDIRIGGNYKTSMQTFYNADAGVNYAIAKIEEGLKANPQTFSLPTSTDPKNSKHTSKFKYSIPSGFYFSISNITKTGTNAYSFTSTGNDPKTNAETTIKATLKRDAVIKYSSFGDKNLDIKTGGMIQSYDSSSSDPTKNDPDNPLFQSTHEADVGANDQLVTRKKTYIDGSGVLGEQADGSPAKNKIHEETIFYGQTPVYAGRIIPDPIGVNSGGVYDPSTYSASNDNASASFISGDKISVGGGKGNNGKATSTSVTLYGKAGGANYYLTSIKLEDGATLNIDTAPGPVNIFLTGPFDAQNGSNITVISNSKDPGSFSIFSKSTGKIDLKNNSDFTGLVYAPYADVVIENSGDVYGAIWGKSVGIKNSGSFYFDSSLKSRYTSNELSLTTWKETF